VGVAAEIRRRQAGDMDPITLEIVKNALEALADEMALVVLRCAYSPIVRDSMDYSTAICDRLGRVIAQGLTNPDPSRLVSPGHGASARTPQG